jgi:tetratricopeptide (TPR) repeat protein
MTRASVLADRGRTAAAHEGFRAAYRVFLALEDRRGQAMALQNIGSIHQDAGDYARVLDSYEAAARLYPDDPTLLVAAHNNRANALKALGRYAEAEAAFREALQVSRTLASPVLEARIRTNMAAAEVLAGDFAAAGSRSVIRSPSAMLASAAAEWRAFLFGVAAQAALKQGDLQRASALLDRTFEGVDPQRSHMAYRDFHRTASEVYGQLRDGRRAQIHRVALRRLDGQGSQLASR